MVAINGELLASTDPALWQAWWMDEEVGSGLWLKISPVNSSKAGTIDLCLVRCGEAGLGKRRPSAEDSREGCVGVECDGSGSARIEHLAEGGAAWLALLAPAQIPPPALAGDVLVMIEGETLGENSGAVHAKVCIYVCVYVYVYVHVYAYIHVYIYVHVYVYRYMYINMYKYR